MSSYINKQEDGILRKTDSVKVIRETVKKANNEWYFCTFFI